MFHLPVPLTSNHHLSVSLLLTELHADKAQNKILPIFTEQMQHIETKYYSMDRRLGESLSWSNS
jgi:hypothetical protein